MHLILCAIVVSATRGPDPSRPMIVGPRQYPVWQLNNNDIMIASSSHEVCEQNLIDFAENNIRRCTAYDGEPSVKRSVLSIVAVACLGGEYCDAKFLCQVLAPYRNCPEQFLQNGLTGKWQMRCPPGHQVSFDQESTRWSNAVCLSPLQAQMRMIEKYGNFNGKQIPTVQRVDQASTSDHVAEASASSSGRQAQDVMCLELRPRSG